MILPLVTLVFSSLSYRISVTVFIIMSAFAPHHASNCISFDRDESSFSDPQPHPLRRFSSLSHYKSMSTRMREITSVVVAHQPYNGTCGYCGSPGQRSEDNTNCHRAECDTLRLSCDVSNIYLSLYSSMIVYVTHGFGLFLKSS